MTIAVIALSVLSALLALAVYLVYRGAVAFMGEADYFQQKYLSALVTINEIKKKLAAEGILLVSAEESAKITGEQQAQNTSNVATNKKTVH